MPLREKLAGGKSGDHPDPHLMLNHPPSPADDVGFPHHPAKSALPQWDEGLDLVGFDISVEVWVIPIDEVEVLGLQTPGSLEEPLDHPVIQLFAVSHKGGFLQS